MEVTLSSFEKPDEMRIFENGRLKIVRINGITIGRATDEAGWKWSEHVSLTVGTPLCEVEQVTG